MNPSVWVRCVRFFVLVGVVVLLVQPFAPATTLQGWVLDEDERGVSRATVEAYYESAPQTRRSGRTNSSGRFYIHDLSLDGTVRVTASKSGMEFTPTLQRVSVSGTSGLKDVPRIFRERVSTYSLQGSIVAGSSDPQLRIDISGEDDDWTYTAYHSYVLGGLRPGRYTVRPRPPQGYTIEPTSRSVTIRSSNVTVRSFVLNAQAAPCDLEVITRDASDNSLLPYVNVRISGGDNDTKTTNGIGYAVFADVPSEEDYTVTAWTNGFITTSLPLSDLEESDPPAELFLTPEGPHVDLVPVSISAADSGYDPGDTITGTYTVQNTGEVDSPAFTLAFYASTNADNSIGGGDLWLADDATTFGTSLVHGTGRNGTLSLPSDDLDGGQTYYLKLMVDKNGDFAGENTSNNVRASAQSFTISTQPAKAERYLKRADPAAARFKLYGRFSGSDSLYDVEAGCLINDFIKMPVPMTAYDDPNDAELVLTTGDLRLDTSSIPGLDLGEVVVFEGLQLLTILESNGQIEEMQDIIGERLVLPPGFVMSLQDLSIPPYTEGGLTAAVKLALPLSIEGITAVGDGADTDVFDSPGDDWLLIDADALFAHDRFEGNIELKTESEDIFGGAFAITDIGGTLATGNIPAQENPGEYLSTTRYLELHGGVELKRIARGTTISLETLELYDFYKPNTFRIRVANESQALGIIPCSAVGIPGAGCYILALDELMVGAKDLFEKPEDMMFEGAIGLVFGYQKVGKYKRIKFLRGTVGGEIWPVRRDFHVYGDDIRLFQVWDTRKDDPILAGFGLPDLDLWYWAEQDKLKGETNFEVEDLLSAYGTLIAYGESNELNGRAEGTVSIPEDCWFFPGRTFSAGLGLKDGFIYGVIASDISFGIRFNPTGESLWTKFKIGDYLTYKQIIDSIEKAGGVHTVTVPDDFDYPYGVIRVVFTEGDTNATLLRPTATGDGTEYDPGNAPFSEANTSRVYAEKNFGVSENYGLDNSEVDEATGSVNQVCFYLRPETIGGAIMPGDYTVTLSNPGGVGEYQVQLLLPNLPPTVVASGPASDIVVDPGDPVVNIEFAGFDPDIDDEPGILLYADDDMDGHDGRPITLGIIPDLEDPDTPYYGPVHLPGDTTEFVWDTTGMPTGDYYIYAAIDDGANPPVYSDYAPGRIAITHPDAPAPPTDFSATPSNNGIRCTWTESTSAATGRVEYFVYYDDQPPESTEPYAHQYAVGTLTETAITGLSYGRQYRVAIAAMDAESFAMSRKVGQTTIALHNESGNNAPTITSVPIAEGRVDYPYAYQVEAIDPDGDPLVYELVTNYVEGYPELASPPPGMTIDPDTGLVELEPLDGHLGVHRVTVRVTDTHGAIDTQEYTLSIDNWQNPNSPPEFDAIEDPQTVQVDTLYVYQAHAEDPEGNQVAYELQDAPDGMTIDANTGEFRWNTTTDDVPTSPHTVTIAARDFRGTEETETFEVTVQYPDIEVAFAFNPDTSEGEGEAPPPSPAEFVFTAEVNYPQYVTNYAWDFDNDGAPDSEGADLHIARYTYDDYELADFVPPYTKEYTASLTITAYDSSGALQNFTADLQYLAVMPPVPVAGFDTVPTDDWEISTGDTELSFGQTALWAEAYAWDFGHDGETGTGPTVTHVFPESVDFGKRYPVRLVASGPSGISEVTRYVSFSPAAGTVDIVIDHPEAGGGYWPDWREAVDSPDDMQGDSLAGAFSIEATPSNLLVTAEEVGDAIAVSREYELHNGSFQFSFRGQTGSSGASPVTIPLMVAVPAGWYPMQGVSGHNAFTDGYEIGKFEVTTEEFCRVLNWADLQGQLKNSDGSPYDASGPEIWVDNGIPPGTLRQVAKLDDDTHFEYSAEVFQPRTRGAFPMVHHPVNHVSWYGAASFCNWLSEAAGLEPCYDWSTWEWLSRTGNGIRLPTEAEWERAAAWDISGAGILMPDGTTGTYWTFACDTTEESRCNVNHNDPLGLGLPPAITTCPVGWYDGVNVSPRTSTQTVDSPSPWGTYNMTGNLIEWLYDWSNLNEIPPEGEPPPAPPHVWPVLNPCVTTQYDLELKQTRGGDYGQGNSDWYKNSFRDLDAAPSSLAPFFGFRIAQTKTWYYNGSTNHYYRLTTNTNWHSAQTEAESLGGNLVTVNDSAENDWLVDTFGDIHVAGGYWVGFSDEDVEGSWEWVSGEPGGFYNWNGGSAGPEDHAVMNRGDTGLWEAEGPTGPHKGIVERETIPYAAGLYYAADFEGAVGPEWSTNVTSETPVGQRRFLGELGNDTVSLTFTDLPDHSSVSITFELFIIRSWDGNLNQLGVGPDQWDLSVDGGPTLLHTTFSGWNYQEQSYPDAYPGGSHPYNTGASEFNTLGYSSGPNPKNAVYEIEYTLQHSGSEVTFNFSGIGLQELVDESWGLDNVEVRLWQERSDVDAHVIWSAADYVRIALIGSSATVYRVTGGAPSEKANADLSPLTSDDVIALRFEEPDQFYLMKNDMEQSNWTDVAPSAGTVKLGLGFTNPTSAPSSRQFLQATLEVPNDPPTLGPLPNIAIQAGGFDGSIDLDAYVADDLTLDADLEFEIGGGNFVLADVDPTTHQLMLHAYPDVVSEVTEYLEIVVFDGGGLSDRQSLEVTVQPTDSEELFTNIALPANVGTTAAEAISAGMLSWESGTMPNLLASQGSNTRIHVNDGSNVYTTSSAPSSAGGTAAFTIGDVTDNGFPDAILTSVGPGQFYEGDAAAVFSWLSVSGLAAVTGKDAVLADVDGDGDLDLYVLGDGANVLFVNDLVPGGSLAFAEGLTTGIEDTGNGEAAAFADVDLDGDVDCYVANSGGANALLRNNGAGLFTPTGAPPNPAAPDSYGALFADFNRDGYPDLYVANDGDDALFLNDGDGTFTDITLGAGITNAASSRSCQALDYDNDGWLDIFVSNNGAKNVLYRNDGDADANGWDGTFSDVDLDLGLVSGVLGMATGAGMGAAVGDIDNDGDVDIWQVNTDYQPAALYRNNLISPLDDPNNIPGRNWLAVRLTGTVSNTSAIGARVGLYRDSAHWQSREVNGGSGWRSQNSPVQHFGVGEDTLVQELVVYWPSGIETTLRNVDVNQILEITEARLLESIILEPSRAELRPAESATIEAYGVYNDGGVDLLSAETLYWAVSNPDVAGVTALGLVYGREEGWADLTASLGDVVSGPAEIRVAEQEPMAFYIQPSPVRLGLGETLALNAVLLYPSGPVDVTVVADWWTDDTAVATAGASGLLRGVAEGTTTVQAQYDDMVSLAVDVEVTTQAVLLALSPAELSLYTEGLGQSLPFTVMKSFEGSGTAPEDVTGRVRWGSDDPLVAWVDAEGRLRTTNPGETQLRAQSGAADSNEALVHVRDHVYFTQQPPAADVAFTEHDYTFEAQAAGGYREGEGGLAYVWYKDDGTKAFVGEGTPFVLANVELNDAGTYYCEASDSHLDTGVSSNLELTVYSGLSVAGVIGLGIFALGLAGGSAWTIRRRRKS